MFRDKKFWKIASAMIAACLLMSLMPEIRILGLFIEAVGLDALLMIIGGHFIFVLKWFYSRSFAPIFSFINSAFEKLDPFYFVAKRKEVAECPQLILHAMPYLVGVLVFLSCNGWLYA